MDAHDERPEPTYVAEAKAIETEDLNVCLFNLSKFSLDGHSWNGKPMINLWENY